jgi:hypothetical protein
MIMRLDLALQHAGVASGTNSTMRELGGVFGVAVLGAVFAGHGGYTSAHAFTDGFTPALWVSCGLSVLGVAAALLSRARPRHAEAAAAGPVLALSEDAA